MGAFIVRRLLQMLIVLFLLTIISFMLMQLIPGDPARTYLGYEATQEQIDNLRTKLWLDRPIIVQYGHWLDNLAHGNLGRSMMYHMPVVDLIAVRLPVTLQISVLAIILSTFFGILSGIICAVRRGTLLDSGITLFANIGISIPIFWLGILGIFTLGLKLGWLPIQGYTSPFDDFWLSTRQLTMPVICLAVTSLAGIARQTRSSMLEVIRQDYIRSAWAKGLGERVIVMRHTVRNGLIPVVTFLGIQIRNLIGGAVLVETVFNISGMGRLIVSSAFNKDFIVIQACVLLTGIMVSLVNLGVDISYAYIDPRIRYE
ncbi:Glutathione transport system permease protein GsiC [subsurface metagenome]